ncbi:cobalamin B12-binding domain-containing protein [Carboxydothermus pertinax]|uniref:Cobalamin-binding protein n=1 Tax=Carboxydothermus pertinax TaxID=870242 RepID=A0A1L8CVG0_9THEO|nr:cobalamin-dependent protein [Carboxydothermus pertinax]GAV22918.1 cobalamin-binding protein [Carboxydothermus pertinax]
MDNELINAVAELDEEKTLFLVKERIKAGAKPLEIVEDCRRGVEIVGRRYNDGTYYLSDLIMSEEILRGVMEILKPYFPPKNPSQGTKIIMGTIEGDIHDLGKNIVIYLLQSAGFEVIDLGVDVEPKVFVENIVKTGAKIVGISVLLTFSISSVKKTVDLIKKAGLRDKVKIIIGGYPVNEKILEYTGADYFENDVVKAVELIKRIAEGKL